MRSHGSYGKFLGWSEGYGFDCSDVVPVVKRGGRIGAVVDVDVEGGVPPLERRSAGCAMCEGPGRGGMEGAGIAGRKDTYALDEDSAIMRTTPR
jgi:hypothetical protein